MDFKKLNDEMRKFEKNNDVVIPAGAYMIARLDGHSFSALTRVYFVPPFDEDFHEMMCATARALMDCGPKVIYAYTSSDEISLLFPPDENAFGRKARKYESLLAGNASADFSILFGRKAVFDCRIYAFPTKEDVEKYFLWRIMDAERNALNSCCYWTLRGEGKTERETTRALNGRNAAFKKELLKRSGIDFDALPEWQRRGVSFKKGVCTRKGYNPVTGETVIVQRNTVIEADSAAGPIF